MTSSSRNQPPERILYEERLWWPWRGLLILGAYCVAVTVAILLIAHPDTTSTIWGLSGGLGSPVLVGAYFKLVMRSQRLRVGERTLKFGRCKPFPVEALREVELVSGKANVDRWRAEFSRGQHFFGSTFNPAVKGILAPPRVEAAIRLRVDPAASPTHNFLLGTHHPNELFAALEQALRDAGARSVQTDELVAR